MFGLDLRRFAMLKLRLLGYHLIEKTSGFRVNPVLLAVLNILKIPVCLSIISP